MGHDPDELRSGADPYRDEDTMLLLEHGEAGITADYSARLAEEILREKSTPPPDTTPRRSGVPQGYGKHGDLA